MMRSTPLLLLVVVAMACSSVPDPSGGLHSETASGPYLLTLDLPHGRWTAGAQITGEAHLSLTRGDEADLGGSGSGVITFNYAEIGGLERHMEGIFTADCGIHQLRAGAPFSTDLHVSGASVPGEPNADFYSAFISAPYVALPQGTWDISAVTIFSEGPGCGGTRYMFETTVRVTITP